MNCSHTASSGRETYSVGADVWGSRISVGQDYNMKLILPSDVVAVLAEDC